MMRKVLLSVVLAVLIGASLAPAAPNEKVALEFLVWYAQDKDINQYLDEKYESKHPNVSVNLVKMGAWDLHDKFLVSLTAGTGAGDVVAVAKRRFAKYSSTGRLLDLTPYVKDLKADFPESLWNVTMHNGKVYGMALDESPALLFYRKDLFEKVGYSAVDTWDQYVDAGRKLKQSGVFVAHQQYPSVNEGLEDMFIYLNSKGGNLYTKEGKVVDPNKDLKDTLTMAYNIHFKDGITKFGKIYAQEFWAGFKDNAVASWPGASWCANFIKNNVAEQSGKWTIDLWPKWSASAPQVTGHWGGTIVTVPGYAKHKEESIELVKWMGGTVEGNLMFAIYNGMYPGYLPTLKDPYFNKGDPFFNGKNMYAMVQKTPIPTYYQWDWAETAQIVGRQLDMMWEQKQDVDTTYANIIKNLKTELGR